MYKSILTDGSGNFKGLVESAGKGALKETFTNENFQKLFKQIVRAEHVKNALTDPNFWNLFVKSERE
ncbi:hypothetical protein [Neorickettsia sennetsu]|uniref:hypothetical protein n=1 Tax=Ehrlichia sennetsu TaxID=951 RepID=UPI0002E32E3A|nr:hypothetical protein [Neorickettsia sennetsu]